MLRSYRFAMSAEPRAQSRQDGIGVKLEKPPLIRTWRVEDQVLEAQLHVGGDLVHVLIGIG